MLFLTKPTFKLFLKKLYIILINILSKLLLANYLPIVIWKKAPSQSRPYHKIPLNNKLKKYFMPFLLKMSIFNRMLHM